VVCNAAQAVEIWIQLVSGEELNDVIGLWSRVEHHVEQP